MEGALSRFLVRPVLSAAMTLLLAIAGGIALAFIINGPITGRKYFCTCLVSAFRRHDLCQIGTHNLSIDHATMILRYSVRRSGMAFVLGSIPDGFVRQWCYVLRAGDGS